MWRWRCDCGCYIIDIKDGIAFHRCSRCRLTRALSHHINTRRARPGVRRASLSAISRYSICKWATSAGREEHDVTNVSKRIVQLNRRVKSAARETGRRWQIVAGFNGTQAISWTTLWIVVHHMTSAMGTCCQLIGIISLHKNHNSFITQSDSFPQKYILLLNGEASWVAREGYGPTYKVGWKCHT